MCQPLRADGIGAEKILKEINSVSGQVDEVFPVKHVRYGEMWLVTGIV